MTDDNPHDPVTSPEWYETRDIDTEDELAGVFVVALTVVVSVVFAVGIMVYMMWP